MTAPMTAFGQAELPAGILEIRLHDGTVMERIPLALAREAIKALPDEAPHGAHARKVLQQWCASDQARAISSDELMPIITDLVEFAHSSPTELGEVGRLPRGPSGRIVEPTQYDSIPMSSAVVMALALQRFVVFLGAEQMGRSLWLLSETEAEGIRA